MRVRNQNRENVIKCPLGCPSIKAFIGISTLMEALMVPPSC